jgi:hypothetical protein
MNEAKGNSPESLAWYSNIAMIASLPLISEIIAYMGLWTYTENYLSERRIRLRMQRCGRFLCLPDARLRIAENRGTLIIENPTIAWDITHAWWKPDDVQAKSPFPLPTTEDYMKAALEMRCEDWDFWCWQNYTCLDNERAFLLRVWNGATLDNTISTWFPDMTVVRTWTGFAKMQRPLGAGNQKKA